MTHGLGYRPDLRDARDYSVDALRLGAPKLPDVVDRRAECPAIQQQGQTSSCVAHACVGAMEHDDRQDDGTWQPLSRLQLYYDARAEQGWEAVDQGCCIGDALKVLCKQGVAPETFWPWDEKAVNRKPWPKAYGVAGANRITAYYRCPVDAERWRLALACGRTVIFGMSCYGSMFTAEVERTGIIPIPDLGKERMEGGHAMLAVGYDHPRERFLLRNSWGTGWGEGGYGWLSYKLLPLVGDAWVIVTRTGEIGGVS